MPAFDFPANPAPNQKHEQNGLTYTWTGSTWDIVDDTAIMLDRKANVTGDNFTGPVYLPPGNPVSGYEATHKNYVDSKVGGLGLVIAEVAPAAAEGAMWWSSANARLYVGYAEASGEVNWVQVAAVGGQTVASAPTPPTYGATITSLTPDSAAAGSAALTVTVNGQNLTPACVVMMDGVAQATTPISDTQMSFSVNPAVETAGTSATITVMDGQFVGTGSIPFDFT